MHSLPYAERVALADKIRTLKRTVSETVTEEFLQRHPDWVVRYGERARERGIEDALYHLDFLTGALESGQVTHFQNYVRWSAGVLRARGIALEFLVENLEQIRETLAPLLTSVEECLISEFVRAGCETLEVPPEEPRASGEGALTLTRNLFLQALLQGQRQAAVTIALEAVRAGHAILDVYVEMLQDALYRVGCQWEENKITVAQEHTATAIAQYVLALLYERLNPPAPNRGKAVITGVAGELHQIGANMVADALETDGWDVRFLGTNLPNEGILEAVEKHGANVVGISTTMLANLPKVRQLIAGIRKRRGEAVRVVVGGGAFRGAPDLVDEIGANGAAHCLREAITFFRGLIS